MLPACSIYTNIERSLRYGIKYMQRRLPQWLSSKGSICNAGGLGLIPGLGRSPGGGYSNPLQYSCLENPMDEEPGGLQSIASQRVRHNWSNLALPHIHKARHRTVYILCSCLYFLFKEKIYSPISIYMYVEWLWLGEGNGNPLQYSCLENPRDRGTWWAAVYGVAQSRTRLKQLSSSSGSRMALKDDRRLKKIVA